MAGTGGWAMTRLTGGRLLGAIVALLPLVIGMGGQAHGVSAATPSLPYVSLVFSRSEMTAMDGTACAVDDANIVRTDAVVAPYLAQLGIRAAGSLETTPTRVTGYWCAHYGESAAISWTEAQLLSKLYGWSFVSHTATYPKTAAAWLAMDPAQLYAETCGSALAISSHGLTGASGMFLWPRSDVDPAALPFVEQCFDVSRTYHGMGVTTQAQVDTAPYEVRTLGLWGGRCNDPALPCASLTTPVPYMLPSTVIGRLDALQAGQWFSLQSFILVTGTNPAYKTNLSRWDCTSPNPADHWSNDAERYCYSDFQAIMAAIHQKIATNGLISGEPASIAAAFGRNVSP